MLECSLQPYAAVILRLLHKPLYHDERVFWKSLLTYQQQIQEFLAQIGLVVLVHEGDGYAFVDQPDLTDQEGHPLPRLMRTVELNKYETVLCIELRDQLAEFEVSDFEQDALLLTHHQLQNLCAPFFAFTSNVLPHYKKLNAAIAHLTEIGFLKRIQTEGAETFFEVRKIIKAKFSADTIAQLRETFNYYDDQDNANTDADDHDDGDAEIA